MLQVSRAALPDKKSRFDRDTHYLKDVSKTDTFFVIPTIERACETALVTLLYLINLYKLETN